MRSRMCATWAGAALLAVGLLVHGTTGVTAFSDPPTDSLNSPDLSEPLLAEDWLTPLGWYSTACAMSGGTASFFGRLYNDTPGTTGLEVNLSTTGFDGIPVLVDPSYIARTPYRELFSVDVTPSVPETISAGHYAGKVVVQGTNTNRLEIPLDLVVDLPCTAGYLDLESAADYAAAADHEELDVGDGAGESLTVEAWLNSDNHTGTVVAKPSSYGVYTSWRYSPYAQKNVYCVEFSWNAPGVSDSGFARCSTFPFSFGWIHVAGVYDKQTGIMRQYVNGEISGTKTLAGSPNLANNTEELKVGQGMSGKFMAIRISDQPRYSGDTIPIPDPPLTCDAATRGLWLFNEGQGAKIFHDLCGSEDNVLVGHNGAHAEGVPVHIEHAYLPVCFR